MGTIKRISDLPSSDNNLTDDDILVFMDDPSGSKITKKVPLSELKTFLGSSSEGTGNVVSVNGKVGVVVLNKSDVGLNNVDNTSDINKPVSISQANADTIVQNSASNDATNKANAAQAFSIQRNHHTGTQLANTISDFNSAVLDLIPVGVKKLTNSYIICEPGDDLATKYAAAKLLTPNNSPLSSSNRATLIIMPGTYSLNTELNIDTEYVDILGLGSSINALSPRYYIPTLLTYCETKVKLITNTVNVTANNVKIKGISVGDLAFKIGNNLSLLYIENCIGGYGSFGSVDDNITAAGTFLYCTAGDSSFGTTASGRFVYCSAGNASFGCIGDASGYFMECSAGRYSYGYWGNASGDFVNCRSSRNSFGYYDASGKFVNCIGSNNCFGNDASGSFLRCQAAGYSFGGTNATGTFTDCTTYTGVWSFGGTNATGSFVNCYAGNYSFGSQGSSSGFFDNCTGGLESFGGYSTGISQGTYIKCRLTNGTFKALSGSGKTRLCIDGNYDVINSDAPIP